jgi:hypothetical protein
MVFRIPVLFREIPGSNARKYLEKQKGQVFGILSEGYPTIPAVSGREAAYLALISPGIDLEEVYVRPVPEQVNDDLLKTWISYCKDKHKFCRVRKSDSLPCKRVNGRFHFHFALHDIIDCRRIEQLYTPATG